MKQNLSTRFTAFGLAALLTLAMLGGVNQLATSELVPETMARAAMLDVPQTWTGAWPRECGRANLRRTPGAHGPDAPSARQRR